MQMYINKRMNKLLYIPKIKYYAAINLNKLYLTATTWKNCSNKMQANAVRLKSTFRMIAFV